MHPASVATIWVSGFGAAIGAIVGLGFHSVGYGAMIGAGLPVYGPPITWVFIRSAEAIDNIFGKQWVGKTLDRWYEFWL